MIVDYDGEKRFATMGPFERSMERDFSIAVNKKAIEECTDIKQLRSVATDLLIGWSNMQGAVSDLVNENLKLRHAMKLQANDLQAAEELIEHAGWLIDRQREELDQPSKTSQSSQSKWRLWPLWK